MKNVVSSSLFLVSIFSITSCGSSGNNTNPSGSADEHRFSTISVGLNSVCGVTQAGEEFCLGQNDLGQFGNGTSNNLYKTAVKSNISNVIALSSGGTSVCSLKKDQTIWCSGRNKSGELGNGTNVDSFVPVQAHQLNVSQVDAGTNGLTCAVTSFGEGFCWGALANRFTPFTELSDSSTPVEIPNIHNFKQISVGTLDIYGLTTDGFVYVSNEQNYTPTKVQGLNNIQSISSSGVNTCVVSNDGGLWCWGSNQYGQLGNGTTLDSSTPIQVHSEQLFKAVSAAGPTTCALTRSGDVYCWGNGEVGQLGNGSKANSTLPVKVTSTKSFSSISTKAGLSCGLDTDGLVWCWGAKPLEPSTNPIPYHLSF